MRQSIRPETERLLILSENFPPTIGGSAAWLGKIADSWPGDVRVLAALADGAAWEESDGHVSVERIPFGFSSWAPDSFASAKGYWSWIRATVRAIRESAPAVVLCGRGIPEGVVARIVRRLTGVPYVTLVHGEEVTASRTSRIVWPLLRFGYRGATLFIGNSANSVRLAISAGAHEARCRVVPPGVDVRALRTPDAAKVGQMRQGTCGKIVLSVGRLTAHKNQVGVVRAVANLVKQGTDVTYWIVGDGPNRGAIVEEAKCLKVADRVRMFGEVDHDTLVALYHAADIFALPGIAVGGSMEGFGMVFLEAGAAGKVSIAGNAGGSGEAVVNGVTGFVVDGNNIDGLAAILKRLLEDNALRTRMGEAARERVAREFDWPIVLGKLHRVVLEALSEEARP